jgi:hypothetical protein
MRKGKEVLDDSEGIELLDISQPAKLNASNDQDRDNHGVPIKEK